MAFSTTVRSLAHIASAEQWKKCAENSKKKTLDFKRSQERKHQDAKCRLERKKYIQSLTPSDNCEKVAAKIGKVSKRNRVTSLEATLVRKHNPPTKSVTLTSSKQTPTEICYDILDEIMKVISRLSFAVPKTAP